MLKSLIKTLVSEIVCEGTHKVTDSETRLALKTLRDADDGDLADFIERSWLLHDKLNSALAKMLSKFELNEKDVDDILDIADDLVGSMNALMSITQVPEHVEESASDAKIALERAWRAKSRGDIQTMSHELSFGVQYPIHNALERLLFDKR